VNLNVDVAPVTVSQAVDGMRRPFMTAFGRGWTGRHLAAAAWSAFGAALMHGSGIALAASHARIAAHDRNGRSTPVARWSGGRVDHVVKRAVQRAADAC
jgi:hypothetical protein